MARLWEIREDFEPEYRRNSDEELYKAYKKGCKHGYEKALEEMGYRMRDDEDYAEYRKSGKMGR